MASSEDYLREALRRYRGPYTHSFDIGLTSRTAPQKYSWVEGLDNCPKCNADVTDCNYYCDNCNYGKDKNKKPPKVPGYDYIVDDDHPLGHYFRLPDKKLFDTVIIEPYKKQMIVEALSLIENNDLIFNKWGFKETIEKGTGVSLLFHGLPGTGKTLMAQAIADYLGKKLVTVTAAEMLDKYVGETEKRIAQVFEDEEDSVILFDECDSLLGSRERARASWEVTQVNTLLNKLENHRGVTVFTTNHVTNLDKALDRRIAVKVRFEMPSIELRKQIWKRMFPKSAPLSSDINWDLLANYEITGGYVKNTVLRAARIAAFRKEKEINFAVLKEALKQELTALMEYEENATDSLVPATSESKQQLKIQEKDDD
ncbi:MAG TPA: ATP-binding protein [Chroococcales cyanobacterium]